MLGIIVQRCIHTHRSSMESTIGLYWKETRPFNGIGWVNPIHDVFRTFSDILGICCRVRHTSAFFSSTY